MAEPRNVGLELRLLGPLEVVRDGRTVSLGGAKPRALLAALALEPGRVVSVDRLVDDLWPGETPGTAAHAIQVYVSQLRKVVGARAIATRPPGYALEVERDAVDVQRFVRLSDEGRAALQAGEPAAAAAALRESLGLWRGAALADFLYEPFAQAEIARLEELRAVVLEERIDADLALGRHAELVAELEALVAAQPLRERPRAQLMLALYRSGRQADALGAYRDARETLVDELGIEPGPELRALEAAILRQDESLLPRATVATPALQFRRLVTVLFVDVVESLALAGLLDPEAFGRVLQRFFELVSGAIDRHGGTVEKYAGDAVMAAFGIPVSHEDDALRAARAAVDVRAGLDALNERLAVDHGVTLEIRIGLETGEVLATPGAGGQRLVTGEAVGVAARLQQVAKPGEIVVGELAGRLIVHAAELEPLGELALKGRQQPVRAQRLVALAAAAPAFERRLDAPLAGRRQELAALRRALKRAAEERSARVVQVSGPAGVGKSRLAAELGRRADGATVLWGRCFSYGEGITYGPLREIVEQAPPGAERDAALAALEADVPPPAGDVALLVRALCEALARDRPLVLVLDDLQWAEPTLLEVIELVADNADGPLLILCLAREEDEEEERPFVGGCTVAERIVLDSLAAEETEALLDALGGEILERDVRTRIVDAAAGNPFFLEQLVALALEGGLAERALPPTVQVLLATRLDRLGPGERAVLERAAVIAKEFTVEDLVALIEPDAAPTAAVHLRTLSDRGFVRPVREGAFGFRHVLVQEAVYRAAPKRLRAQLHERYANRLDQAWADQPDLDELTGYHLEQAHRLRLELGEADRGTQALAADGGGRLGEAGIRAWKRNDVSATVNLLGRATALLPEHARRRLELLCELGPALRASGDPAGAREALEAAIAAAAATGDRALELRARLEFDYVRLLQGAGVTAEGILGTADEAAPVFEAVGDHRSLGRARLIAGFVEGGYLGRHLRWQESAEQALAGYRRAAWPTSTCLGEIAGALYYGPAPVADAVRRCDELLADEDAHRAGKANVLAFLGGLRSQRGELERARELIGSAATTFGELGQTTAATIFCATVLADVELLAAEPVAAESILRELCRRLEETHDFGHLASRANDLAEALFLQGRLEEAFDWTRVAEARAAADDLDAQTFWRSVRAKLHARRGEVAAAVELATGAASAIGSSDGLNRRAKAQLDLADVLRLAGRPREADAALAEALELYERKGNIVAAARIRDALREAAPA